MGSPLGHLYLYHFGFGLWTGSSPRQGNNGRSVHELGVSYSPLEETVVDFFQKMVDSGMLEN